MRAGSLTPPMWWIGLGMVPREHVMLWSMYGHASVKSETHLPQRSRGFPERLGDHLSTSTSSQLPHPSLLSQLLKSKSPSSDSWRPKQKGNGSGAPPAQVRPAMHVPTSTQSASLPQVRPSTLQCPGTGAQNPEHSVSSWHNPPCPEQNPTATHFPPGQQLWVPVQLPVAQHASQIWPSRSPPSHCISVSGPQVPVQSDPL